MESLKLLLGKCIFCSDALRLSNNGIWRAIGHMPVVGFRSCIGVLEVKAEKIEKSTKV